MDGPDRFESVGSRSRAEGASSDGPADEWWLAGRGLGRLDCLDAGFRSRVRSKKYERRRV